MTRNMINGGEKPPRSHYASSLYADGTKQRKRQLDAIKPRPSRKLSPAAGCTCVFPPNIFLPHTH